MYALSLQTVECGTREVLLKACLPAPLSPPPCAVFLQAGGGPSFGESGRGRQQGPALSVVCQSICEGPTARQGLVGSRRARSCLLGLVLKQTQ